MKREHRLRYIIKEGLLDTFYIWKDELRNVFKDAGVLIFFFLVPFVYPLLYSFIYNNEVVHEAKMVVVDQSDSYLSREFTRRVNATPDVEVVGVCPDMAEAKKMFGQPPIPLSIPMDAADKAYGQTAYDREDVSGGMGLLTPEGPAVDAEEKAFIRAMKRKKKKKRKGLGL